MLRARGRTGAMTRPATGSDQAQLETPYDSPWFGWRMSKTLSISPTTPKREQTMCPTDYPLA